MSQLRKCDICGYIVKNQPDLPDYWTSLSSMSLNGDRIDFGQIDICNACRSKLAEYYECLENGTFIINADFYSEAKVTKEVLRFILNREKN